MCGALGKHDVSQTVDRDPASMQHPVAVRADERKILQLGRSGPDEFHTAPVWARRSARRSCRTSVIASAGRASPRILWGHDESKLVPLAPSRLLERSQAGRPVGPIEQALRAILLDAVADDVPQVQRRG